MKTSDRGVAALVAHEGVVPGPYLDSVGVWTVYIGHTAAAGDPIPATMTKGPPQDLDAALRKAFAVFRRDLAKYESDVIAALGRTPVEQHEFDAAVSFHFNTGAIRRAAWVDLWKSGRKDAAARSMVANWRKPAEIVKRREDEAELFLSGKYPDKRATVWDVGKTGRVIWKPLRTMSQAEIIELVRDTGTFRPEIKQGDICAEVKEAQSLLLAAGHDPKGIDGNFGGNTRAAVMSFQTACGLPASGIITPATWAELLKGKTNE